MKLNKVMALALSGLMAVSMLAGCSSDPSNGDGGNTEVTPPASTAVSVMNDSQGYVEFEANSDFDAALAAAAKKAKQDEVKDATYTVVSAFNDSVYQELAKKLPVGEKMYGNIYDIYFTTTNVSSNDAENTRNILVYVKNEGLSEEAALKQIASQMDKASNYPEIVSFNSKNYKATYTGNVSIVTVNTADNGDTASAYYIAVSVTQTISRDAVV